MKSSGLNRVSRASGGARNRRRMRRMRVKGSNRQRPGYHCSWCGSAVIREPVLTPAVQGFGTGSGPQQPPHIRCSSDSPRPPGRSRAAATTAGRPGRRSSRSRPGATRALRWTRRKAPGSRSSMARSEFLSQRHTGGMPPRRYLLSARSRIASCAGIRFTARGNSIEMVPRSPATPAGRG